MKPKIRLNQIWKQKGHDFYVLIAGKKGGKWSAKVLTLRPGVYAGTHTLAEYTIYKKYELQ